MRATTSLRTIKPLGAARTLAGSAARTRVQTLLHRRNLDTRLAAGADPSGDSLLRARAGALLRHRKRCEIADALERAIGESSSPSTGFSSRIPIARRGVRNARPELDTLVEFLKAPEFSRPQCVAMALLLLTDGTSPLFDAGPDVDFRLKWAVASMLDAAQHGPAFTGNHCS